MATLVGVAGDDCNGGAIEQRCREVGFVAVHDSGHSGFGETRTNRRSDISSSRARGEGALRAVRTGDEYLGHSETHSTVTP